LFRNVAITLTILGRKNVIQGSACLRWSLAYRGRQVSLTLIVTSDSDCIRPNHCRHGMSFYAITRTTARQHNTTYAPSSQKQQRPTQGRDSHTAGSRPRHVFEAEKKQREVGCDNNRTSRKLLVRHPMRRSGPHYPPECMAVSSA
jgi:hypothetical protein